ncbi:MAG TPA: insulinase family protein, partial [Thermoanaerobaculia bacterium]
MKTKKAAIAFVLALCAGGAFGQKQTPPPPAAPKNFEAPAATKFRLENGLDVTLVPYGTVPKVRVELAVLAGNAYESAKQISLADLAGDLMREGTTTKTASQISQAAARMGGSLDVAVSVNAVEISGDVLSEFGPEMARLVADVAL